jgi:hypothetical protein
LSSFNYSIFRELDPSIAEAVSSICWAAPRVTHEIAEMKKSLKYFERCYGQEFTDRAMTNDFSDLMPEKVGRNLIQKMTVTTPSRALIEK